MADSLASIALEKLTNALQQQLTLFAGATHELERLKDSFQSIQAVLRDAESRQVAEESVRVWLSKLKHVAYDIDDVLDEGKISGLGEEGDNDEGDCRNKVCQCLLPPCNYLDHLVSRYKVARRIKEIMERLDDIAADKNNYSFSSSGVGGDHRMPVRSERLTSSFMDESEMIVGRENDREIMISRLLSGSSHQVWRQVHVVAIVGIGGLGKTTLARQICNDGRARDHFNKVLWVCVTEVFDVIKLTKAILEELGVESFPSELNPLQKKLREQLEGKSFLLVLDDVWNDNEEQWKKLELSLTSGDPRSRILVTTRSERVANTMKATYTHGLRGLSGEQSWKLFSSRAFAGRKAEECLELECIGRKIVSHCKGVPLSVKVIGSAMQSKRTVEDWENVSSSNTWSSLPQATNKILPALLLTYSNLPTHLKQCFAYCSMFPKDWKFNKDTLVRLWMAQGFVQSEGNRETEDVGTEYFDELVAWCMFQEVEEDKDQGTVCKMHDLLHDLAEFVAKDDIYRFISVIGGKSEECPGRNVRHAFLSFPRTRYASNNGGPFPLRRVKKLRTLFLDEVGFHKSHRVIAVNLFQQARFLRSLIFQNSGIERLPNGIGKMKHLRYLDLSGSEIEELPESVSHLRNLHTLNLNKCNQLKTLPRGIGRIVSLRHLQIQGAWNLKYLPKGLGRISGLQSLSRFIVGGGGEGIEGCRIDELQELNSLHGRLEIENLDTVSSREEAEKAQLWNKPYLRRLVLRASGRIDDAEAERMDNVTEGLRPHVNLEELRLDWYRGSRLPSWMDVMRCLRKLELCRGPKMERVPHLPSLKEFHIYGLTNEIIPDGGGWEGLVALQKLTIENSNELKCLPEGLGQLKKLNSLVIHSLGALRCLPDSLGQLESLEHLHISFFEKLELLPDSLGELKALNDLEIWHCKSLGSLPDSLGQLESLQNLQIKECENLESLPHSFGQLKALNRLEISKCDALRSLPDSLGQLELLENLQINCCWKLELLPHSFGQLKALNHLEISYCHALVSLPDSLGHLESLQHLRIESCEKLESLPHSFGRLKGLNHLVISVCNALKSLPDSLRQLESLQHLGIGGCEKLELLPHSFGQLKVLNHLTILGCPTLRSLPDSLGQLESLQRLKIIACKKLESLPDSFGQLKALSHLEISHCDALRSLPDGLQQLSLLRQLRIIHCPLLSERCKRDGGEDWPKISHIPDISIEGFDEAKIHSHTYFIHWTSF